MKANLCFLILVIFASSCKKEYTCRCFNPGGTIATYSIRGTKEKAADKCAEYGEPYNYPMSESGCMLE
ncbi:MAG TPA: hypothetical protein VK177_17595 [Flavobacteriales bacterium]|nr:hypothetical protein [Flavobacteriales bacterium]